MTRELLPPKAAGSTDGERGALPVDPVELAPAETESQADAALTALQDAADEVGVRSHVEHWGINE